MKNPKIVTHYCALCLMPSPRYLYLIIMFQKADLMRLETPGDMFQKADLMRLETPGDIVPQGFLQNLTLCDPSFEGSCAFNISGAPY